MSIKPPVHAGGFFGLCAQLGTAESGPEVLVGEVVMKIVSFNVNSIRARLHQLEQVIEKHEPEFIALQETKVQDMDFPEEEINSLGYHAVWHGQKTHYGVATLSKRPCESFQKGFADEDDTVQRRAVMTVYRMEEGETFLLVNGYFPQGESRSHPTKFPNKKLFYDKMTRYVRQVASKYTWLAVVGDMNVAPAEDDIGIGAENARRWLRTGKCSFLPEERSWLKKLQDLPLQDCYRKIYPAKSDCYSWFDYRSRGFMREPKRGLRIDLILAGSALASRCVAAGIDYEVRGMEKPSDHAPVWAEFRVMS